MGTKALHIDARRGIAGVYPQNSSHVYATSHYWDTDDELACAWDEPELGFDWPVTDPILSPRDENAGSFSEMRLSWNRFVAEADPRST